MTASLRRQFLWLVVVLLAVGAARFLAGQYLTSRFEADLARVAGAQRANQAMLQAMTDAETGVRGYELTGEPQFLQPYDAALTAYPLALADAGQAAGTASVRSLLRTEDAAARAWLVDFAHPVIAARSGATSATVDAADGKRLFDALRGANARVAAALDGQSRQTTSGFHTASVVLELCLAALAALSVLIALRLGVRTRRLLVEPLAHLQDVVRRRAAGDRDVRAVAGGPPEVRALIGELNEWLERSERAKRELRNAHDELIAQKVHLTQVLDGINIAVATCDAHGTLVHLNRVAREARRGAPPGTVAELNTRISRDEGVASEDHPLTRALLGEVTVNQELLVERPGRRPKAMMVDAAPLRDPGGQIVGAVASGYDVSALREREAELAAFAGVAAHDLKTPLTTIAGYTEILAEQLAEQTVGEELLPVLDRIGQGVKRMRYLIDNLLAYATARDAALRPEPVDLQALAGDIVADRIAALGAKPAADQALPHIVAGPLPTLHADPGMIRQLLDNLIGNAVKYTPPGQGAWVELSAELTPDGGVHVQVADRGIGIPPEQQADVFTSFHRAHRDRGYAGTGLGLAICQRVMERHGGTISADDNPGGGTRMHLTFPAEVLRGMPASAQGR